MKITKTQLREMVKQQIEERCQKGYKTHEKRKTKKMFGKQYRNCVKAEGTELEEDKSGEGKCPDSGCITKRGDKWRIISNKTGKLWPQTYDSEKSAEDALDAYHASR